MASHDNKNITGIRQPAEKYGGTEQSREIKALKKILPDLRAENKILAAILYGSFSKGNTHARSDIDLAIYLNASNEDEGIAVIDKILMRADREVSILRRDDEDESPFIIQKAPKGIHLVEPDKNILYKTTVCALHDAECIRFRRGMDNYLIL